MTSTGCYQPCGFSPVKRRDDSIAWRSGKYLGGSLAQAISIHGGAISILLPLRLTNFHRR